MVCFFVILTIHAAYNIMKRKKNKKSTTKPENTEFPIFLTPCAISAASTRFYRLM